MSQTKTWDSYWKFFVWTLDKSISRCRAGRGYRGGRYGAVITWISTRLGPPPADIVPIELKLQCVLREENNSCPQQMSMSVDICCMTMYHIRIPDILPRFYHHTKPFQENPSLERLVRRIAWKEISPSFLGKAPVWCQDPTKNQHCQLNWSFWY